MAMIEELKEPTLYYSFIRRKYHLIKKSHMLHISVTISHWKKSSIE